MDHLLVITHVRNNIFWARYTVVTVLYELAMSTAIISIPYNTNIVHPFSHRGRSFSLGVVSVRALSVTERSMQCDD